MESEEERWHVAPSLPTRGDGTCSAKELAVACTPPFFGAVTLSSWTSPPPPSFGSSSSGGTGGSGDRLPAAFDAINCEDFFVFQLLDQLGARRGRQRRRGLGLLGALDSKVSNGESTELD